LRYDLAINKDIDKDAHTKHKEFLTNQGSRKNIEEALIKEDTYFTLEVPIKEDTYLILENMLERAVEHIVAYTLKAC
jgi:hypothetical protein